MALGLALGLRHAGHQALIVGPRRHGRKSRASIQGIPIRRVAGSSELLSLARSERPDIWHSHIFARPHRALTRAAASGRWPMLATLHLVLPDYLKAAGGRQGLQDLLRRAAHVTAVSRFSLDQARRLFPAIGRSSSVVANGMTAARPSAEPTSPHPYILCASRLAPYKGLDVLLMAFAQLKDRHRSLKLILCGRDQLHGGLKRFARDLGFGPEVVFAGDVPPHRLRSLLNGCLFFALPSRRENMPLALLEAMAAGKPVLATTAGGIPEIISHGKNGLLVPPGDVNALSSAMEKLASDRDLRIRLGTLAIKRSSDFDWRRSAADYARLYARYS